MRQCTPQFLPPAPLEQGGIQTALFNCYVLVYTNYAGLYGKSDNQKLYLSRGRENIQRKYSHVSKKFKFKTLRIHSTFCTHPVGSYESMLVSLSVRLSVCLSVCLSE